VQIELLCCDAGDDFFCSRKVILGLKRRGYLFLEQKKSSPASQQSSSICTLVSSNIPKSLG
jgi:hypothetical protein